MFYVPAVDGNRLQYPEMDILGPSKNPRIARQRRSGAFHHEWQYRDPLSNRQLERTLVERQDLPVGRPCSFRKENDGTALSQVSCTLQQRLRALSAVGSVDRDVAGHAQHPAQHRELEQLRLGEPFRIQLQVRNQRDVTQGLVIANDDVHLVRVQILSAGNVDSPGIDFCQDTSKPAEPATGSQTARLDVK